MLPDIQTEKETVTVKVKPIVQKEPEGIGAVLIDIADGRDNCSVNVVISPQGREHQKMGIRTKTEELFSEMDLRLFRTRWPRRPLREL